MTEREAEQKILRALAKHGPLYNGTLGAVTGLSWRSKVFKRMEVAGMIEGHPFALTSKGRTALGECAPPSKEG